ncbi:MAG: hypothetical protein UW81_C0023G0009 [Candidatus Giovannonibacteria bacterium GW2011_GWC2_44_9]|uniref:Uncharacterized protein n=3 Tax=Candidatus Giovannoniibacteriota TaxID=1752738 RepID=A0A0G1IVB9_9BACT|nr:MAG: hypothetical protein UW49_C0006G0009 [Candidatus Giovannonibacteria bacterium GW2011_GWB1_44_23]KKT63341.1 MAG: hypothetical protein UW57_C0008G0009 [Candidatus Giovannonibacteria bacterium GW2011_GWA1_44_29]KKT83231.1 MAG: hypothetical protein UW81_C0023G0009 [Candidatus Giovannonibacteria bacterium GW2011_GWC2_44_9]KKT91545.1 MAG: hypothetical protein UW93_C0005G0009 [Parcubacteria group bacterium GW2011_GWC1_45_13]
MLKQQEMPFALRFAEPLMSQEEISSGILDKGIFMATVQTTVYATGKYGADSKSDPD